ncbi:MAG: type II secretion system F family protein [Caulobacteraceae bacterium]|nr:type II secretion system F family protein [Caulobacteraceae bacterium]
MTAILIIVALVLLLAGAATLAAVTGAMRTTQRIVKRRVDAILPMSSALFGNAETGRDRANAVIQAVLGVGVRRSWDSQTPTLTLLIPAVIAAAVTWGLLCVVFRLPIWLWAPGTIVGMLIPPQIMLRLEQARLEAKFVDVFPDAVDMIVRMLRAGLPMSATIRVVGTEAASPVKEVFAAVGDQMTIGVSFERALIAAGRRIRAHDFRFFTVAASLQQATGGNLATTLEILSEIIRRRRAGRLKARAVTGEVRMSAYVLAAMPFAIIGGLLLVNASYLAPLITDRRGNVIIAVAIGGLLSGFAVMRQMMRSVTRL